ncbi:hypothetical protein BJ165DRAFT_1396949 [Panaeolus papilionaceus]|nr:hypothetical protein BJ165DRAFT_1396949 [Panaeolus papilionaceus]
MFSTEALVTVLALVSSAVAHVSPSLVRRIPVSPLIIKPDASSVWVVGSVQTVTWETNNFPPDSQINNPIGQVFLGRSYTQEWGLRLNRSHPLAKGFNIRDGSVQITVPDVPPLDDYLIVLFGNADNASPSFSITRNNAPGTNTSSSATPSSTTSISSSITPSTQGPSTVSSTQRLVTTSILTIGPSTTDVSLTVSSSSVAALPTSISPSADASDSPILSSPIPSPTNTGVGFSIYGFSNVNVFIAGMIAYVALVVV